MRARNSADGGTPGPAPVNDPVENPVLGPALTPAPAALPQQVERSVECRVECSLRCHLRWRVEWHLRWRRNHHTKASTRRPARLSTNSRARRACFHELSTDRCAQPGPAAEPNAPAPAMPSPTPRAAICRMSTSLGRRASCETACSREGTRSRGRTPPRTGVEYGTSRRFSYVPPVTGPPAHSFPPGAKGTRPGGTSPYGRCNAIRVPDSVWRTVDVPHSESIRAVRHPATGAGGSYQPTGKVNGAVGAGQRWSGRVATRGSRIDATMPAANAAMVARSWKR
jgi:hypothetical protein